MSRERSSGCVRLPDGYTKEWGAQPPPHTMRNWRNDLSQHVERLHNEMLCARFEHDKDKARHRHAFASAMLHARDYHDAVNMANLLERPVAHEMLCALAGKDPRDHPYYGHALLSPSM